MRAVNLLVSYMKRKTGAVKVEANPHRLRMSSLIPCAECRKLVVVDF